MHFTSYCIRVENRVEMSFAKQNLMEHTENNDKQKLKCSNTYVQRKRLLSQEIEITLPPLER